MKIYLQQNKAHIVYVIRIMTSNTAVLVINRQTNSKFGNSNRQSNIVILIPRILNQRYTV